MTAYIAHKRVDGTEQKLKDHLNNVASLAAAFASPFSAESDASLAGWLHDLGKYGVTSQRHMQDPEHTRPCDHSTAGLQKAIQLKRLAVAFAVAGHHAGLPDRGSKVDSQAEATLCGRNARKIEDTSVSFQDGICLDIIDPLPAWTTSLTKFDLQFYIRMLFSCLVDADYLDTEAFLQPDLIGRGLGDSMDIIEKRFLSSTFDKWKGAQPGTLNAIRTKIFEACYTYALPESGLASLSVPTGGGKTAASFALAVKNCMDYGKKRIIYVIPYTSIIEQNAALFRQWIGNQNVVEHHSGIQPDRLDDEERTRWQLACENWDAPVIITTSVQFFDSLFACRPGKCRKLHNIADSVVIFDEVQMMPLQCLRPCIGAIVALTKHYRVTAVLCTATQPALESVVQEFSESLHIPEICPDTLRTDGHFHRVSYRWEELHTENEVATQLSTHFQVLCVVNRRSTAREIYESLPEDGRFLLTTMLTAHDREHVISQIRKRLDAGETCRVVSTSLIECGVDLDFPTAYREEAGLDSILQTAGRCNRNGKDDFTNCIVHVFTLDQQAPQQFRLQISATEYVRQLFPTNIDSEEAIAAYFSHLRILMGKERQDSQHVLDECERFAFRKVAEQFSMIGQSTIPVYIPNAENMSDIQALSLGICSKAIFRRLDKDMVSIYAQQLNQLLGDHTETSTHNDVKLVHGMYVDLIDNAFCILTDTSLYDTYHGLTVTPPQGMGWFE